MEFIIAVVLGVVQGLTEFLPVSSSGHLAVTSKILGVDDWGAAFGAIVQIGTELAVIAYFFKDIVRILSAWGKEFSGVFKFSNLSVDAKMGWMIILATIPIILAGVVLKNQIETVFRGLPVIAFTLVFFGVILLIADSISKSEQNLSDLTPFKAFLFGLAQILALVPGVSRSGATISAGRFLGFDRPTAAKFSFYLAIPSVFGAALFELLSVFKDWDAAVAGGFPGWPATIVATVISFIVGYGVVALFMKVISQITLKGFAVYRIIVGIALAVCLKLGIIS